MKYDSFPWPPVLAAHDRISLASAHRKLLATDTLSLYPAFSSTHQTIIFPSNCAEDDFRSKSHLIWQSVRLKGRCF